MKRQALLLTLGSFALMGCVGVHGPAGNDVGGIIPWSPENELHALEIAQPTCARYNKYAVISSVHRQYGDYIAYRCRWDPPRRWHRRSS